jgi:hypothetical protein
MSHVRVMKNDLAGKVLARTVGARLWLRTASLRPCLRGLAALLMVWGMGWQAAYAEISAPPTPQTIDAPALAAWAPTEERLPVRPSRSCTDRICVPELLRPTRAGARSRRRTRRSSRSSGSGASPPSESTRDPPFGAR